MSWFIVNGEETDDSGGQHIRSFLALASPDYPGLMALPLAYIVFKCLSRLSNDQGDLTNQINFKVITDVIFELYILAFYSLLLIAM